MFRLKRVCRFGFDNRGDGSGSRRKFVPVNEIADFSEQDMSDAPYSFAPGGGQAQEHARDALSTASSYTTRGRTSSIKTQLLSGLSAEGHIDPGLKITPAKTARRSGFVPATAIGGPAPGGPRSDASAARAPAQAQAPAPGIRAGSLPEAGQTLRVPDGSDTPCGRELGYCPPDCPLLRRGIPQRRGDGADSVSLADLFARLERG